MIFTGSAIEFIKLVLKHTTYIYKSILGYILQNNFKLAVNSSYCILTRPIVPTGGTSERG